jgi:tetratricopeptide (TPR) repeat protein
MALTTGIVTALRNVLPQALHPQAEEFAQLLADLINDVLSQEELSNRLASPALAPLLRELVEAKEVVIPGAQLPSNGIMVIGNVGVLQQITASNSQIGEIIGIKIKIDLPPVSPATHQLRAPRNDFVGHEEKIAKLVEALAKARSGMVAAIAGVRGMGGIGKTELAYVVANRLRHVFPDLQLLLDLQGSKPSLLTPVQALQRIFKDLEPETRQTDDLGELLARYRTLLYGKRALILADDARDAEQVQVLQPPPGCALLITSRRQFTFGGMTAIDLTKLADEEAIALQRTICERLDTGQAQRIATLCGNLPLALRISASLLASDDTIQIEEYVGRLADERRLAQLRNPDNPDYDSVEASLNLSYVQLDDDERRVFSQLGVFHPSFDQAAAAAVVGAMKKGQLATVLGSLRRRNLLEFDTVRERYNLHELVRVFARSQLKRPAMVYRRYAAYYLRLAEAAAPELQGPQQVPWLNRVEQEHDHIREVLRWAVDKRETETALRLGSAMWRFWNLRGYLYEGREWLDLALKLPEQGSSATPDLRATHAQAYKGAGILALSQDDFVSARTQLEASLALYRELHDHQGIAAIHNNLGLTAFYQGNYEQANSSFSESLRLFRELDETYGIASTLANLAMVARCVGNYYEAVTLYEESLALFRTRQDLHNLAMHLANLGRVLQV